MNNLIYFVEPLYYFSFQSEPKTSAFTNSHPPSLDLINFLFILALTVMNLLQSERFNTVRIWKTVSKAVDILSLNAPRFIKKYNNWYKFQKYSAGLNNIIPGFNLFFRKKLKPKQLFVNLAYILINLYKFSKWLIFIIRTILDYQMGRNRCILWEQCERQIYVIYHFIKLTFVIKTCT